MNKEIGYFELYKTLPTNMTQEQAEKVKEAMNQMMAELVNRLSNPKTDAKD